VYEIACEEVTLAKHIKLDQLCLTDTEWARVGRFINLLAINNFILPSY
jgi:hypothetical protein